VSWDQRFAEPIVLPDGIKLASLREAIAHLVKTVPSSERGMRALADRRPPFLGHAITPEIANSPSKTSA
jgi:hypothetical protein